MARTGTATRLLVLTTLYPNEVQQRHGIFVETRLRHLVATGDVSATVVAPVPWFPFSSERFSEYSAYRNVPPSANRHGIAVYHPRYLVIPKIGMLLTPFFMALSLFLCIRSLRKAGVDYDVVDAHYYYPDGVAAAMLLKYLKKPLLITARGTDINLIPEHRLARRMILWAAEKASASITVCKALKDRMQELGADPEKIHVMRNGVDLQKFSPLSKASSRQQYGITGTTLVSVGHLIERKGHNHIIDALQYLPDVSLLIAGDGEEEQNLKRQVAALELQDRVQFAGAVSQQELAVIYSAADIMVLASSREGWANVLLESMACGTPVVATDIWGTPEVVQGSSAGVLVSQRNGQALAEGVKRLLAAYPDRADTRAYAETFSWEETVQRIIALLEDLVQGGHSGVLPEGVSES